ncbi:killer cell lectin-like receptor subfamily B member 1A [Stylophora pistillata]|uniref:killer cell lectin-like receptor subfamily B member 1A n=1 Tax=Stylophora pistillata TaxID=50429 RepID=UPI000C047058|nr:killer cell lectin-like receptor subfamily B member 1A [Stylophora pistillata]
MIVEKMYVLLLLGVYLLLKRIDGERLCSCYTFSKDQWLWTQARDNCKRNNKILAVIESVQEWQFITNGIQNKTGTISGEWYIGLKKNLTTQRWNWINGKPLTIDKWHDKGINPDPKDSYGVIHEDYPPGFKGSLSTVTGDQPRGWICEEETATCKGICFHHPVPTSLVRL